MKHIIKLISILILFTSQAPAQSLQMTDPEHGSIQSNDTLQVIYQLTGSFETIDLEKDIFLLNSSQKEIVVGAKKVEFTQMADDLDHNFCFGGTCFSKEVFESPFTETLPAGESDFEMIEHFTAHYAFEDNPALASSHLVAYVFWDTENPADSSIVYVQYHLLSDQAPAQSLQMSDPEHGPIQSHDTLQVNYQLTGSFETIDLEKDIFLLNSSQKEIVVGAKKVEFTQMADDLDHNFCFGGTCFSKEVFESPFTETLPAGESDFEMIEHFTAHYAFEDNPVLASTHLVAYVFWDTENPADSSIVFVKYQLHTGSGITGRGGSLSGEGSAFSFPGGNRVYFQYPTGTLGPGFEALYLTDISGKLRRLSMISADEQGFLADAGALNPGIYYWSFRIGKHQAASGTLTIGD